ncbi:hypothetical protein [Changchengzhania lutea]|uniref:hypothetical protein n=1 Tax=Changchengzhania lutea TaxID=2049305 RepID=UPI00115E17F3|nr:hypothetical protein [Changchengzhania lutea]
MKRILLFFVIPFFILSSFVSYCQNEGFYYPNGDLISKNIDQSINSILELHFPDINQITVHSKSCDNYEVVFKKFTETTLFVLGEFPKSKRSLKKCIEAYNVINDYSRESFKSTLDDLIEKSEGSKQVFNIFGNPQRETIYKELGSEITIYNYNKYYGTVKFDLIFENDKLIRYIKY